MAKLSNNFLMMIAAILLGLIGGLAGMIIIGSSDFRLPLLGRVSLMNENYNKQQIVIEQPRNVIIEQDTQLKQIEDDLFPALIGVYPARKEDNPLANAYLSSDVLGQGFALTADGWVVLPNKAINNVKAKYTAIGYQKKSYDLTGFVEDTQLGLTFAHMTANNLPVARLGKSSELTLGQTVVLVADEDEIVMGHIKKIGYEFKDNKDLLESSDIVRKTIYLDIPDGQLKDGAAVVNLKGEIVGIVNDGRIIMSDYLNNVIKYVLNGQKISRPVLGVNYIDLAQVDGLITLADRGAFVYGALDKNSPATGKILDGDIIKKVNDTELNVFEGLSEAISSYKTGDKVELTVLRAAKEISIEVTLK